MQAPVKKKERHEDKRFPISVYKLSNKVELMPHFHEDLEIMYIKRGELEITLGPDRYRAQKGDIFFPGIDHVHSTNAAAGKRCIYYALVFDKSIFDMLNLNSYYIKYIHPFISGTTEPPASVHPGDEIYDYIQSSVELIIEEISRKEEAYEIYVVTAIERLFAAFARNTAIKPQRLTIKDKQILDDVMGYIKDNYLESVGLAGIARFMNMSKGYLCRKIRLITGRPFTQLVNMYRINRAEAMLTGTDLPVSEIANKAGFNNLSYFNRMFLHYTGVVPSSVRSRDKRE